MCMLYVKFHTFSFLLFLYPSLCLHNGLEGSNIAHRQVEGSSSDLQTRDIPRISAFDSKILDEMEFGVHQSVPDSSGPSNTSYSFQEHRGKECLFGHEHVFTKSDPGCTPTTAVCIPDRVGWVKHFAHTTQRLLPCFSVLRQMHPNLSWVVIQQGVDNQRATMSSWNKDLLNAMQIEVRENATGLGCKVTSTIRHSAGAYCLMGPPLELHRRMGLSRKIAGESAVSFKAGIINRLGSRRWPAASAFIGIASQQFPHAEFEEAHFEQLSFSEQAKWINKQDLIITPHGAAETNLFFARRCVGVLEMSPMNYHVPGWFASLANVMGAQFYAGYPEGRNPRKDVQANWDCCRSQARSAPVLASPESVFAMLERAVANQTLCYQGAPAYLSKA